MVYGVVQDKCFQRRLMSSIMNGNVYANRHRKALVILLSCASNYIPMYQPEIAIVTRVVRSSGGAHLLHMA